MLELRKYSLALKRMAFTVAVEKFREAGLDLIEAKYDAPTDPREYGASLGRYIKARKTLWACLGEANPHNEQVAEAMPNDDSSKVWSGGKDMKPQWNST